MKKESLYKFSYSCHSLLFQTMDDILFRPKVISISAFSYITLKDWQENKNVVSSKNSAALRKRIKPQSLLRIKHEIDIVGASECIVARCCDLVKCIGLLFEGTFKL